VRSWGFNKYKFACAQSGAESRTPRRCRDSQALGKRRICRLKGDFSVAEGAALGNISGTKNQP